MPTSWKDSIKENKVELAPKLPKVNRAQTRALAVKGQFYSHQTLKVSLNASMKPIMTFPVWRNLLKNQWAVKSTPRWLSKIQRESSPSRSTWTKMILKKRAPMTAVMTTTMRTWMKKTASMKSKVTTLMQSRNIF